MSARRTWWCGPLLLGAAVLALTQPAEARPKQRKPAENPRVEVVFCLDTTGSMSGLIDGAKQKIWSICNQIAAGKPTPEVKVGLVGYRDKGDAYVTKIHDLTDDLDAVHVNLRAFEAAGGGDEPESVNEALHVAVNKIQWSQGAKTLRIIYLVGDAPPHLDYANDVPYAKTCRLACEKGIIINTIQCGSSGSTTKHWKEIAAKAEGRFVQIAQDGGVQTVSTPFDARLAEINTQLTRSTVTYGDAAARASSAAKLSGASCEPCAPTTASINFGFNNPASAPACGLSAAADRAGYCAKTGRVASFDLLDNVKAGKVKLEEVATDDLPDEMKPMTLAQRKAYLAKIEAERTKLQTEALELDRKRTDYLERQRAGKDGKAGFDGEVLDALRKQAGKCGLAY